MASGRKVVAFHGARIWTAEEEARPADCLLIEGRKIVDVGAASDLLGQADCSINLDGSTILPGFVDIHTHALEGGRVDEFELKLSPAATFQSLLKTVARAAQSPNHHGWVLGHGWGADSARAMESEDGLRALDAASGEVPLLLRDVSYHSRICNSAALRIACISSLTSAPQGGLIVKDVKSGAVTGLLHEMAGSIVDAVVPPYTSDQNVRAAKRAIEILNAQGITTFGHAVTSQRTLEAFRQLERNSTLSARMAAFLDSGSVLSLESDGIGEELVRDRSGYASRRIMPDFAKFFMDGVPSMGTASFFKDEGKSGEVLPFYSSGELVSLISPLDRDGISVKVHAVGDRAIAAVLDAMVEVRAGNREGPLHQIAHLSFIRPKDIERLAKLRVVADLCPPMWFPTPLQQEMRAVLGDELVDLSWPVRALVESGAVVTVGSDWPCVSMTPNPWPGLSTLLTRRNSSFPELGAFRPDQCLSLEQALELHTINPARALGIANRTGSLSAGKSADFIVIKDDIFAMNPEELEKVTVAATYLEGRLVHGEL